MVHWLVSLGEQDSDPVGSATHLSEIKFTSVAWSGPSTPDLRVARGRTVAA